MVVKPAIGFVSTDSDALLVTDAQTIVIALTNNPSYPTPSPTLASITTAINDFATAIANAANGGKELTAIKNAKREALCALLRQLASYVHVACGGVLAALLSSGFPIQKAHAHSRGRAARTRDTSVEPRRTHRRTECLHSAGAERLHL